MPVLSTGAIIAIVCIVLAIVILLAVFLVSNRILCAFIFSNYFE